MMLNVNEPETRGMALALQTMLDDLGKGVYNQWHQWQAC